MDNCGINVIIRIHMTIAMINGTTAAAEKSENLKLIMKLVYTVIICISTIQMYLQ